MKPIPRLIAACACVLAASHARAQQAQTQEAEEEAESEADSTPSAAPGLGIQPGTARTGDLVLTVPDTPGLSLSTSEDFEFEFHGFLRAPMRVGFGSGEGFAAENQGTKLHSPPQLPDATFTDWQYTNNLPGPWAELRFAYGNETVTANTIIAAYNITDSGYRNLQAQLGINQAFITLNFPELFGARGGIVWTVGAFQNRYGTAGRYDAGKYETFLFGQTHVAGETLTAFYDLNDDLRLQVEHGIGAKLEVPPLVAGLPEPTPPYLPYAGPEQQGSTLLHHAHAGVTYDSRLTAAFHYLTTWTDDARLAGEVDGRLTSVGGELRLIDDHLGTGYLGYGHARARDIVRLGESLELLHSFSGWNLRDNFFGQDTSGTGTIDTILFQYTLSVASLLWHPKKFWGQAPDLKLTAFGMYNHVDNSETTTTFAAAEDKLKWGGEATYTPLPWLGVSLRYDLVQPDLDDDSQNFQVISPKVIIRSGFLAHEQIVLQYSGYIYGDNVRTTFPHVGLRPDDHVVQISAVMWW